VKTMYVGLENILVLISAFRNEGLPRPVFSFRTGKNQARYVYVRSDIKELANIEFGVISELPQRELSEVVEFLNSKYKLRIINEIADNGEGVNAGNIIYADYADFQGNRNYRARLANLHVKKRDTEKVKWFSDIKLGGTTLDRGCTLKQLRKIISQKCYCGFEEVVGTVELKDILKTAPQRRAEDSEIEIFVGLEGVLALVSEYEEEFPKPKFKISGNNGKVKNIYLRKDISEIKGFRINVISALNIDELSQIVKQLNEKYELNIVKAVANNARGFVINNENIIYADCTSNNPFFIERMNNLKALRRERFIEMCWFSAENTGDSGATLEELKRVVRQ